MELQVSTTMPTRTLVPSVTWVTRTRLQLVHMEVLKHKVSLLAVTTLRFLTMRSSKQFPCKSKTCQNHNRLINGDVDDENDELFVLLLFSRNWLRKAAMRDLDK